MILSLKVLTNGASLLMLACLLTGATAGANYQVQCYTMRLIVTAVQKPN
jgi:hypothetical protein